MREVRERGRLFTLRALGRLHLFPSKVFLRNPFKILEFDEIERLAAVTPEDTILDIGCGAGLQTILLGGKSKHATGVDLSEASVHTARTLTRAARLDDRVAFQSNNILRASFKENQFSVVVSFCVLEHIEDWRDVLRLTRKWLKPGGVVVLSVDSLAPIHDKDILEMHRKEHSVATYFDRDSLTSALREAGFERIEIVSLFSGNRAVRLFKKNIINGFGYSLISAFIFYLILRNEEMNSRQQEGIFLLAKARAPQP